MDIIKRLNNDEMAVDAIDDAIAEITALRAALDQERERSAKLRMIFDVMGNDAYHGDVPLDVLIDSGVPEEELQELLDGPRIDALLSGRGEGEGHVQG